MVGLSYYTLSHIMGYVLVGLCSLAYASRFGVAKSTWVDVVVVMSIGSVLGARVGHVVLYEPLAYREILDLSQGGMSFFGSFVICAVLLWHYAYRAKQDFWHLADFVILFVPLGLLCGRIGNFLNNELWGRDPLGIWPTVAVFDQGRIVHKVPMQLFEAFFEGVVLFVVLMALYARGYYAGRLSVWFMMLYGAFRGIIEVFKPNDGYWLKGLESIMGGLFWLNTSLVFCVVMSVTGMVLHTKRRS